MAINTIDSKYLKTAIQYLKRQSRNPEAFFNLDLFLKNNPIQNQNVNTDHQLQLITKTHWNRVFEVTQIWDQNHLIKKYHARLQQAINQVNPDYQLIYQLSSKTTRLTNDASLTNFVYSSDDPDLDLPLKNQTVVDKLTQLNTILTQTIQ